MFILFNILDIVDLRVNSKRGKEILKKIYSLPTIKSESMFIEKYGKIINAKCTFEGAYNDIISDAYVTQIQRKYKKYTEMSNIFECLDKTLEYSYKGTVNFRFFLTKDTLWITQGYKNTIDINFLYGLLIAYVLSQISNKLEYKNIKQLCFLEKDGKIRGINISDIPDATLYFICKDLIGYNIEKGYKNWKNSYGTNKNKLFSILSVLIDCEGYTEVPNELKGILNRVKPIKIDILNKNNSLILKSNALDDIESIVINKKKNRNISIYYISDLHLDSHVNNIDDIDTIIDKLIKSLGSKTIDGSFKYDIEKLKNSLYFFMGDIGSNLNYLTYFYSRLHTKLNTLLDTNAKFFFILGNHELYSFDTVEDGIIYFKEFAEKENICFLHNSVCMFKEICIIGGTGFAKYNKTFNATNVIGAKYMSREDEIIESEKFYNFYDSVLDKIEDENKKLFVLSHYPTNDWLEENNIASNVVYFFGHTHKNTYIHKNGSLIIANNQIGYKNSNINFLEFPLYDIKNPFLLYEDGCYEIDILLYKEFLQSKGLFISTSIIERSLFTEGSKLYIIKQEGYYGFFILNPKKDAKICYKGKVKNIENTKGLSIDYFYNKFYYMVQGQINVFRDYYMTLSNISKEVKYLGLEGTIHGCIVDLDFEHHIMLHPLNGSMIYYFSPYFGTIKLYKSFGKMLKSSMKKTLDVEKYNYVLDKYIKLEQSNSLVLYKNINNSVVIQDTVEYEKFQEVSRSEGEYGVSREMNKYQLLFEHHILSVWDERFVGNTFIEIE